MMMLRVCESDEHGAEHREHVGLHKGDQQLQGIHKQQHDDAEEVQSDTKANTHGPTKEDDAAEAEYHRMACHHVGK